MVSTAKVRGKIGKVQRKSGRIPWESITVEDADGVLKPMNGEEIVEDIHLQTGIRTSRQNISNALKSAMRSFFVNFSKMEPELSPFQVASTMLHMLYLPNSKDDKEFRGGVDSFFRLFPKGLKKVIEDDDKRYYTKMKDA